MADIKKFSELFEINTKLPNRISELVQAKQVVIDTLAEEIRKEKSSCSSIIAKRLWMSIGLESKLHAVLHDLIGDTIKQTLFFEGPSFSLNSAKLVVPSNKAKEHGYELPYRLAEDFNAACKKYATLNEYPNQHQDEDAEWEFYLKLSEG
jgi:hypothetical protein